MTSNIAISNRFRCPTLSISNHLPQTDDRRFPAERRGIGENQPRMAGEGSGVRERVRRAIAGPVAESEKLLADLRDAETETSLSILVSGWFRGLAAAIEELAIAVDDIRSQRAAESTSAGTIAEEGRATPSPAAPAAETSERVDLSEADAEQMIDTARNSREEAAKLRQEAEQARRELER
jgi:hypothetical protein